MRIPIGDRSHSREGLWSYSRDHRGDRSGGAPHLHGTWGVWVSCHKYTGWDCISIIQSHLTTALHCPLWMPAIHVQYNNLMKGEWASPLFPTVLLGPRLPGEPLSASKPSVTPPGSSVRILFLYGSSTVSPPAPALIATHTPPGRVSS